MLYTYHCKTIQVQHFINTQHITTTTRSKSFQEYNMNGKGTEKIKHNLKTTYKFASLGLNITLSLCITKKA